VQEQDSGGRDPLRLLHDRPVTALSRPVVAKPLVLLAAKVMGPGPLRLKMVKLAHKLDDREARRVAA
jgi:hypothetical protein